MNSLQGVISLRRHIPVSQQEHDFTVRWNNLHKAGLVDGRLNAFGFYAYDAVWAIAHSIDTFINEGGVVSFTDYPQVSSASGNKTELTKLKVFGEGQKLLNILSQTNFTGLTGPVKFGNNGGITIVTNRQGMWTSRNLT